MRLWVSYAGVLNGAYGEEFTLLNFDDLMNPNYYIENETLILVFVFCSCHFHRSEYKTSAKNQSYKIQKVFLKPHDVSTIERKEMSNGEFTRLSLKAWDNLILDSDRFINLRLFTHHVGERPLLIIQPISMGEYEISTYVAECFYDKGWNSIIVEREPLYRDLYDPQKLIYRCLNYERIADR